MGSHTALSTWVTLYHLIGVKTREMGSNLNSGNMSGKVTILASEMPLSLSGQPGMGSLLGPERCSCRPGPVCQQALGIISLQCTSKELNGFCSVLLRCPPHRGSAGRLLVGQACGLATLAGWQAAADVPAARRRT